MPQGRRTTKPLPDELPRLLQDKGLTLRGLARAARVDHAHLSRMLRRQPGKRPSGDLAQRIAKSLGLPADYFPEARLARVIEQVSRDGNLRDQLYDRLKRRR